MSYFVNLFGVILFSFKIDFRLISESVLPNKKLQKIILGFKYINQIFLSENIPKSNLVEQKTLFDVFSSVVIGEGNAKILYQLS